jgi:Leucine-rich repeat (LRR) protein
MKSILFSFIFFLVAGQVFAQDLTAKQIDQKMTEIREKTNWDNPAEAKKANEEIQKLSDQLMNAGKKKKGPNDEETKSPAEQNKEYNMNLFKQMMKTADKGKGADVLLAEPLREEIVEEYRDDESPKIKNQEYLDEMTILVIDMSLKTAQRTIDQMDKFKSIKTLIITGGKFGTAVDLNDLLTRAKGYPLEELYIMSFKIFVKTIPKQIINFKNLKLLSVIDNQIDQLPLEVGAFNGLKALYVDMNPLATLMPAVNKLNQLEKLGVGKTNITDSEIDKIKQLLPNCKILLQ